MADDTLFDDDYGTCNETYATLRVTGGESHPGIVSAQLCLEPTTMRVRGQSGVWRQGEWRMPIEQGRTARSNHWSASTQGVVLSRDSRRHVHHLLSLLATKEGALETLRREGWSVEIIVFWDSKWGHGGPSIDPAAMRRLSQLDVPLWFDVYFSEPERAPEKVEGHPGAFRIPV